eukprot:1372238-Rhodomonas_salina.7
MSGTEHAYGAFVCYLPTPALGPVRRGPRHRSAYTTRTRYSQPWSSTMTSLFRLSCSYLKPCPSLESRYQPPTCPDLRLCEI